jgi:hypothetical protein
MKHGRADARKVIAPDGGSREKADEIAVTMKNVAGQPSTVPQPGE